MIGKLKNYFLVMLLGLANTSSMHLYAQTIEKSVLSTSGEIYNQSNIELQWTLGEMGMSQLSNSGLYLEEGFHAGMHNSELSTAIHDLQLVERFAISPNPTTDFVTLPEDLKLTDQSRVLLFSTNGSHLSENTRIRNGQIDLRKTPKGMYYIMIVYPDKTGRMSKVVKL